MFRRLTIGTALAALVVVITPAHALVEDFSSDPFAQWSFGAGDNSNSQFGWNSAAPAQYAGDAVGSLAVHLDSSLPTARLDRALGVSVTQSDSFALTTRFSFSITSAPVNQFMQIAFGLVNSSLTGGDRTGSFADFTSDNTFHTIEFAYFPNLTTFTSPASGRTLTPVVFGAQNGGGDAFANIASIFGSDSNLSDNLTGITALPELVVLQADLTFDGIAGVLTLTMNQVNPDGSLTLLNTEVPALDLNTQFLYDVTQPFVVDTLAIMAYRDGFTDPSDPSLVADVTFERFEFAVVPEPSTALLVILGIAAAGLAGQKRR